MDSDIYFVLTSFLVIVCQIQVQSQEIQPSEGQNIGNNFGYAGYQFPMAIGSGYDTINDVVVQNMIAAEYQTEGHTVEPFKQTSYSFKLVNTLKEVRDMVGATGKFSVSAGDASSGAGFYASVEGSYLDDLSVSNNQLMIMAVYRYNTRAITLKDAALKGRSDCRGLPDSVRGTHFVRSVVYGGAMVGFIKIISTSKSEMQKITGNVSAGLGANGISVHASTYLEEITNSSTSEVTTSISIISTCGVDAIPTGLDTFQELVKGYSNYVDANCPDGNPLQVELVPIDYLESCQALPTKQEILDDVSDWGLRPLFDYVSVLYDDVKIARRKLTLLEYLVETLDVGEAFVTQMNSYDMQLRNLEVTLIAASTVILSANKTVLNQTGHALVSAYERSAEQIPKYWERAVDFMRSEISACPYGLEFFGGNCYILAPDAMNYSSSSIYCARRGGYLTSITNEDMSAIQQVINNYNDKFWIGLKSSDDGSYSWDNGNTVDYLNLFYTQPYDSSYCRVAYKRSGSLAIAQESCSTELKPLCRIALGF